jgi:hypothetical protein
MGDGSIRRMGERKTSPGARWTAAFSAGNKELNRKESVFREL